MNWSGWTLPGCTQPDQPSRPGIASIAALDREFDPELPCSAVTIHAMMVRQEKIGRRTRTQRAHGRGESMGLKQIRTILLVPFAVAGIGMRSVEAQVASTPASSAGVISLEAAGEPSGGGTPPSW